jgi:hypothetical protein
MSGSASLDLNRSLLQHSLAIAPMAALSRVYVALCVTPPTETVSGVEASGGGYARVAATFALLAGSTAANAATVEFPAATGAWGAVGYFEIWDQPVGGARLYWGPLVDPADNAALLTLDIAAGDIVRFSAGTLLVKVTDIEQHSGGQTLDGALGFWGDNTTVNDYDAKIWATGGATVPGNPGHGELNYMAGRHVFQGYDGTTQFRVANIPWAWSWWEASGGSAETAAVLRAGGDLNADCDGVLHMQGHGKFTLGNGEGPFAVFNNIGAQIINYFQFTPGANNQGITLAAAGGDGLPVTFSLTTGYSGGFVLGNGNGRLMVVADGQATGSPMIAYPRLTTPSAGAQVMTLSISAGTGTNIPWNIASLGTGEIGFFTGTAKQMRILNVASATNIIEMFGAATGGSPVVRGSSGSNLLLGNNGGLATNATSGFIQIAACAGTPTGTPANPTSVATLVYDSAANKLWVYSGSAWRSVTLT